MIYLYIKWGKLLWQDAYGLLVQHGAYLQPIIGFLLMVLVEYKTWLKPKTCLMLPDAEHPFLHSWHKFPSPSLGWC